MVPLSMAATNGLYLTRVTRVNPTPMQTSLVLASDSRRYYVRFEADASAGFMGLILPGPAMPFFSPGSSPSPVYEYKWRDAPAICTGEFYAYFTAGSNVNIIEQLYVGD